MGRKGQSWGRFQTPGDVAFIEHPFARKGAHVDESSRHRARRAVVAEDLR